MSSFDIELFINLVRTYECLYDKKNKYYKDIRRKENIWKEIAGSLNATVDHCKDCFKKLKDRYARERKNIKKKSGSGFEEGSSWSWFNDLHFLNNHIHERRRTSNYSSSSSSTEIQDILSEDSYPIEFLDEEIDPLEENETDLTLTLQYESTMKPSTSSFPETPIVAEQCIAETPATKKQKSKAGTVKLQKKRNIADEIEEETLQVLKTICNKRDDDDRVFSDLVYVELKKLDVKKNKAIKKKIFDLIMADSD